MKQPSESLSRSIGVMGFAHKLHIMEKRIEVKFKKMILKEIREKLDITQEEAAKYLGIDQSDFNKLETGRKVPDWFFKAFKLHKLLKEAGYSLDDLAIPPMTKISEFWAL